jgi:acylphosphatase
MGAQAEKQNAKAFYAQVRGRVQGVGFRYSAVREAGRLGVKGWVRNAVNGDVEIWAEGSAGQLEVFSRWLRRGPQFARVDAVEQMEQPSRGYKDFGVEY